MTTVGFDLAVGPDRLDDLQERLSRTRYGDPSGASPWEVGVDADHPRELVRIGAT